MGFERVDVCERIEINPALQPFFDHGLARLVAGVSRTLRQRSPKAQRIYGLMSTYLRQAPCCTVAQSTTDESEHT